MDLSEFDASVTTRGWALFPRVLEPAFVERLKRDVAIKQQECRGYQIRNGIGEGTDGTAHHILGGGTSLDEFLAGFHLDEYIAQYFDGPYILNSYGAVLNVPEGSGTYVQAVHRDVRTYISDFRLLLNMLVMLDDFTVENGATRVLSGSHRLREKPADAFFADNSEQVTGAAGSILLFDSRLWHATGRNTTARPRVALTLTFSRPFVKQQMDYPRFVSKEYAAGLSERLRQLLGYDARVPASYDEWYQPPQRRMYKSSQG